MSETTTKETATDWNAWLGDYYRRYETAFAPEHRKSLRAFHDLAVGVKEAGRKLIFAGNGASASIASHGRVDFTKQAKVRSVDFNEPNLITAFSNDFADPGDVAVLISVSGRSPNIVKAAEYARDRGIPVVAFSGSAPDNPLRGLADVDFWIDSKAYNVVECVHMIWLTTVVDMVVGRAEYSVN
jgi:D-sedoheptulose 7-phosphate isomerase